MSGPSTRLTWRQFPALLQGDAGVIRGWIDRPDPRSVAVCIGVVLAGAGLYGAAVGMWRAPLQAGYNALKFPLIVLLTTAGNGLLNGMFAPLLGLPLRFSQSLLAILMSFALASAILGAFSPLVLFLVWNTPPLTADPAHAVGAHNFLLLSQVAIIAFAGIAANLRLWQLLCVLGGSRLNARKVLLAWLAANLFLGSQCSWILRPFIGSPKLAVEFLRPDAFSGSFFESLFHTVHRLLFN